MNTKLETPSFAQIKSLSIFGEHPDTVNQSLHRHNVAGLLPFAADGMKREVDSHYSPRAGALDYTKPQLGIVAPEVDKRLETHAAYLEATIGKPFKVYEYRDLQNGSHPADTLVVPYYHDEQIQTDIQKLGQESWGLDPRITASLKNKVDFHRLVEEAQIEGMDVPDYKVATLDNFTEQATDLLRFSQTLYEIHGLSGQYPLGLVIRAEESDGNYGQALIKESDDGSIVMTPDGNKEKAKHFPKGEWDKAIAAAKTGFNSGMKNGVNPQFVISRFLDLVDDPGLSIVVKDGHVASLGWNRQLKEEGTTACIGTTKFIAKDRSTAKLQAEFEEKTAEDFGKLLRFVAKKVGVPFDSVNAVINDDNMLPGPLEERLREARGQGKGYYVAEANPRFTNYTDGVMAVVGFNQMTPSINSMERVINNGIVMIDRKPMGGADPDIVRDALFHQDQFAIRIGDPSRAFLRMPDDPAGIILTGNRTDAEKKVNHAIKLAGGVVFDAKGN